MEFYPFEYNLLIWKNSSATTVKSEHAHVRKILNVLQMQACSHEKTYISVET